MKIKLLFFLILLLLLPCNICWVYTHIRGNGISALDQEAHQLFDEIVFENNPQYRLLSKHKETLSSGFGIIIKPDAYSKKSDALYLEKNMNSKLTISFISYLKEENLFDYIFSIEQDSKTQEVKNVLISNGYSKLYMDFNGDWLIDAQMLDGEFYIRLNDVFKKVSTLNSKGRVASDSEVNYTFENGVWECK